jgi:hypothetical protein
MKTPWLRKIDLRKITSFRTSTATKNSEHVTHPDINLKSFYLIKLNKEYYVGKFTKEWYGLCFSDGSINFSLDDDGIKGIWQIKSRY